MEYWDLYDENRILTGEKMLRGSEQKKGTYRLVVHVCIFNSKNEMLIQQRQTFKKGWPNMWDITLGGCALTGEDSKTTANRETLEELGIEHDFTKERPYLTMNFDNGFDDIYLLFKDIEISELKLQEEEVQNAKWAGKDEILKMLELGEFIPYHKSFVEILFDLSKRRGAHR